MTDWRRVRLRRVCDINPPTPEFGALRADRDVTFLPLEAIWPDDLDTSRVRPKRELESGYTRFREGDVLVPKITPTFEASRAAMARGLLGGVGCGTTELHVLRSRAELDARFLFYVTHSRRFLQEGAAAMQGVAGQKRVPECVVAAHLVDLPPLKYQRRIANFLDRETARIDQTVERRQQELSLVRQRLRAETFLAVIGAARSGRRSPSGLSWVADLPESWWVVPLRYVAKPGSGHTPSRSVSEYWENCTIPWISLFDVGRMRNPFEETTTETAQRISELGLANSSAQLHPPGTVVLSRTASVGFATLMGSAMAVSQHFVTWTCSETILPVYLLYLLRAMHQEWEAMQVGTTNVTVFMPDLMAIRIPLPPLQEQSRIVAEVRDSVAQAARLVSSISRQLSLLEERRLALITTAVTGGVDVAGLGYSASR